MAYATKDAQDMSQCERYWVGGGEKRGPTAGKTMQKDSSPYDAEGLEFHLGLGRN